MLFLRLYWWNIKCAPIPSLGTAAPRHSSFWNTTFLFYLNDGGGQLVGSFSVIFKLALLKEMLHTARDTEHVNRLELFAVWRKSHFFAVSFVLCRFSKTCPPFRRKPCLPFGEDRSNGNQRLWISRWSSSLLDLLSSSSSFFSKPTKNASLGFEVRRKERPHSQVASLFSSSPRVLTSLAGLDPSWTGLVFEPFSALGHSTPM